MANELTIPLLPCPSIDEIASFYEMLGFEITYRQTRPNPHVALRREDINLHFFGMDGYDPAQSYSTCLVVVPDINELFEAFAAAEKWMSVNRGRTYGLKRQNAPWRKGIPTDAQVRRINRLGLDLNWRNMNAGQVHDTLEFHHAQQTARERQRLQKKGAA